MLLLLTYEGNMHILFQVCHVLASFVIVTNLINLLSEITQSVPAGADNKWSYFLALKYVSRYAAAVCLLLLWSEAADFLLY